VAPQSRYGRGGEKKKVLHFPSQESSPVVQSVVSIRLSLEQPANYAYDFCLEDNIFMHSSFDQFSSFFRQKSVYECHAIGKHVACVLLLLFEQPGGHSKFQGDSNIVI
jgi:hypothetical protein